MNFDVEKRTILKVRHGSYAYGTNIESSDVDIKGVCIEPREYHFGFIHNFEQFEAMVSKGHPTDLTIYSLKKFAKLAASCNPNIIEVLHVDDSDVLFCDLFGEELRSIRDEFLSKRARYSFAGYAHAQLNRIKTHRTWVMNPPTDPPTRKEFHLSETSQVSKSELGAFDEATSSGMQIDLPKGVLTIFTREKQYRAAVTHYDQYLNWKKSRNPVRTELEAKFGYDTKHGGHLIRLMRMAREILVDHKVYVKRPDREEILAIRRGEWSYDKLIDEAAQIEAQCEELYKTSTLRHEPDMNKLNEFVVELTQRYIEYNDHF
jgi:predicted nucleotidyltransferase